MGTVSVDLVVNLIPKTAWSLSGNQDGAWQYGTIPIPPIEGGFQVLIRTFLYLFAYDRPLDVAKPP